MKNTKQCPKCTGQEIIVVKGFHTLWTGADSISVNVIKTGWHCLASVDRYICEKCGYSEEWLDKDELEKVKQSDKDYIYKY